MPVTRYAIYYAPRPGEPLAEFGSRWLRRDAEQPDLDPAPIPTAMPAAEQWGITAEPRRYGFHATLKPPFALRSGATENDLLHAVRALADQWSDLLIAPLHLKRIGRFVALTPSAEIPDLQQLAAECVAKLDHLREPSSPADMARRRGAGLTALQDQLLQRWGYPYVMEEFRFHLTLTGSLDPESIDRCFKLLEPMVVPFLRDGAALRDLVIFIEADGAPMRVLARVPLRPSHQAYDRMSGP